MRLLAREANYAKMVLEETLGTILQNLIAVPLMLDLRNSMSFTLNGIGIL